VADEAAPSWRELADDAIAAGIERDDVRRMLDEVGGVLDERSNALTHHRFRSMVQRRLAGEPLQYVLGSWGFRSLDLLVDRRVLIPRPETEWVVEEALRRLPQDRPCWVVDLGTGSGAMGFSIAVEHRQVTHVVATDVSPEALAVARANLAGIGRRATRVSLQQGSWWDAVPSDLRGTIDMVVSNPPYVAANDVLPPAVADWEPTDALIPGPTGLEAIEVIIEGAPSWLRPGGWLVCEIGETQGSAVLALAEAAGFVRPEVLHDLTGRDRMLVGRAWA
jgi:release factor glutamine methyltransferase